MRSASDKREFQAFLERKKGGELLVGFGTAPGRKTSIMERVD
jgi:hypothetical protein